MQEWFAEINDLINLTSEQQVFLEDLLQEEQGLLEQLQDEQKQIVEHNQGQNKLNRYRQILQH